LQIIAETIPFCCENLKFEEKIIFFFNISDLLGKEFEDSFSWDEFEEK